jgi:predicted MFS family arabinose efflux permease
MGYNAAVLSVGTAIYPSLGGALALLGWYVPFALPILGLGVALAVLVRLEAVEVSRDAGLRSYLGEALEEMRSPRVLGLYLNSLVTFIVLYGAYTTFIPLHLAGRFDTTPPGIGLIMTVGSLATAVTAGALGTLSRRFTQTGLMITGFVLYAASFLIIPWLPGAGWVALPVALFGVAQGMNYPVVMSMLAAIAPTRHRGVFMSANGMVLRAGQTLGPLVMGGVSAWWGMDRVFHVATGICLTTTMVLPWFLRAPQEKHDQVS